MKAKMVTHTKFNDYRNQKQLRDCVNLVKARKNYVSNRFEFFSFSLFPFSTLSLFSSVPSSLSFFPFSLLFHISSLFLFSMTMTMITGSAKSVGALSARVHGPWPFHCLANCSTQLSGCTCLQSVPLEIKWACTFAGDGDGEVFTWVKNVFAMLWYVVCGMW